MCVGQVRERCVSFHTTQHRTSMSPHLHFSKLHHKILLQTHVLHACTCACARTGIRRKGEHRSEPAGRTSVPHRGHLHPHRHRHVTAKASIHPRPNSTRTQHSPDHMVPCMSAQTTHPHRQSTPSLHICVYSNHPHATLASRKPRSMSASVGPCPGAASTNRRSTQRMGGQNRHVPNTCCTVV